MLDEWGFRRRMPRGQGVIALFAGPPGTGKTTAAEAVAHALRQDLYRVDLSAVVSKYIGETEKNLAAAFDEAERASAVLFFDEADSLFGKRTEVKDAHDRYANLEVNYLLQRIETFTGLVLLATNRQLGARRGVRPAAALRDPLRAPRPARCAPTLWRRSFPPETALDGLDWDELAAAGALGREHPERRARRRLSRRGQRRHGDARARRARAPARAREARQVVRRAVRGGRP